MEDIEEKFYWQHNKNYKIHMEFFKNKYLRTKGMKL